MFYIGLDCRKLTADDIVAHTKRHPVTLYTLHIGDIERETEREQW